MIKKRTHTHTHTQPLRKNLNLVVASRHPWAEQKPALPGSGDKRQRLPNGAYQ